MNPGASSRGAEATASALFDYATVVLEAGHLKKLSRQMLLCTVDDRQLPCSQEFQKDPNNAPVIPEVVVFRESKRSCNDSVHRLPGIERDIVRVRRGLSRVHPAYENERQEAAEFGPSRDSDSRPASHR